ncbi:MAG TPA: SMEK domain-containing protein [Gemmata sp.]|jgi:hypothetical protein|nr:SMEK domain-containing protein [Gemmata sp.]
MVLKKEPLLKKILDGLSVLRSACEDRGKLGLLDLHVLAESFFCPFLNETYGLNLKVLKTRHPAVDLGDTKAGVAFQITADNSKEKIQDTLDKHLANNLVSVYPSVKVLIIGKRKPTYTVTIPKRITFDQATDVLDIQTLGAEISKMGTARIGRLAEIISAEIINTDVKAKATKPTAVLEVSLNGEILKLPETTCTFAPNAGWGLDLVFHNISGEVMEASDYSIAFILPRELFVERNWHIAIPVHKNPVRINGSDILFEMTQFGRLLPGARERHSVVIRAGEDSVELGESVAITIQVHNKYGKTDYPVKLAVVTTDENLAAIQHRNALPSQANQAAILMLTGFIQTLEGGTRNLPPVSWKRTFSPFDPECAHLSKKQMIQRLFSTTDHEQLVLYLGAVRGMYAKLMQRRDVQTKYVVVCQAFGVSYDDLI